MFINSKGKRSLETNLLKKLPKNINIIQGNVINITFNKLKDREKSTVSGLNYLSNKNIKYKLNCKNIVISAGVNSSCILERSGIFKNKNIGKNIKNQVGPSICIKFMDNINFFETEKDKNLGIIGMGFTSDITLENLKKIKKNNLKSKDSEYSEDRKYQIMISSYPYLDEHITNLYNLNQKNVISINMCNLNPKSSGQINIHSTDIMSQPEINLNIYKDQEEKDLESGIESLKIMYQIYKDIKKMYNVKLLFPEEEIFLDEEKIKNNLKSNNLKSNNLNTEHYTGGCRMGKNSKNSVIDYDFFVHGINGLRVCDASSLPYCPDGNPQYTCMLLGLRLGKILCSEK